MKRRDFLKRIGLAAGLLPFGGGLFKTEGPIPLEDDVVLVPFAEEKARQINWHLNGAILNLRSYVGPLMWQFAKEWILCENDTLELDFGGETLQHCENVHLIQGTHNLYTPVASIELYTENCFAALTTFGKQTLKPNQTKAFWRVFDGKMLPQEEI
jgi:hypothetical protein